MTEHEAFSHVKTNSIYNTTEWPQNIHEYHRMVATAQANAIALQEMQKETPKETPKEGEMKSEQE